MLGPTVSTVIASALVAAAASAQLMVDQDLGPLSATVNLVGTTVGAPNNADMYSVGPVTPGDPSNILSAKPTALGERVYGFELTKASILFIQNNQGVGVGADTDHFLLSGLAVDPDVDIGGDGQFIRDVARQSLAFVDEVGLLGLQDPGEYYLSVDTASNSFEGAFDISLLLVNGTRPNSAPAPNQPTNFVDLGIIATDNHYFTIDTAGSNFDTSIGLFDAGGSVVETNDNSIGIQSRIDSTDFATYTSLGAGDYFLMVSGGEALYNFGFAVSPSLTQGTLVGQANGVPLSAELSRGQVLVYRFTVVPSPSALLAFLPLALATLRRRSGPTA